MASNASLIFDAANVRLQDLLGDTWRPHVNIFTQEEESARTKQNGFSLVLLSGQEKNPTVNAIFLERQMRVTLTHRTFAGNSSSKKVKSTLASVYDIESEVIESMRLWQDASIGLIKVLPKTSVETAQSPDGEDDFLTSTITFTLQYRN